MNKLLTKIQKSLNSKGYVTELKDGKVLSLFDVGDIPFAYLYTESNTSKNVYLSLNVSYTNILNVASLIYILNKVQPCSLVEPFYISHNGVIHSGEQAIKAHQIESIDLNGMTAINSLGC